MSWRPAVRVQPTAHRHPPHQWLAHEAILVLQFALLKDAVQQITLTHSSPCWHIQQQLQQECTQLPHAGVRICQLLTEACALASQGRRGSTRTDRHGMSSVEVRHRAAAVRQRRISLATSSWRWQSETGRLLLASPICTLHSCAISSHTMQIDESRHGHVPQTQQQSCFVTHGRGQPPSEMHVITERVTAFSGEFFQERLTILKP